MRAMYDDNSDDVEEEESFSGFSIVDESGKELSRPKNKPRFDTGSLSSQALATPIPENEMLVIIETATEELPAKEAELSIDLASGFVLLDGEKIGGFRPAFLERLAQSRKGQYAKAFMHSTESPVMVKLIFTQKPQKGSVKI